MVQAGLVSLPLFSPLSPRPSLLPPSTAPPPQMMPPPQAQYQPPPAAYQPPPPAPSKTPRYTAIYDYTAADDDEVSFVEGKTIAWLKSIVSYELAY